MSTWLTDEPVRVEFEELGEGLSGDYNESDPTDIELLRFYVQVDFGHGFEDLEDCSYCTQFPVNTTEEEQEKALRFIMDNVWQAIFDWMPFVDNGDRYCSTAKHICERLSWIDPTWIDGDKGLQKAQEYLED
jgi:hypothetical protein